MAKISMCTCGHLGGASGTAHANRWEDGHGPCRVEGCDCEQFTWAGFVQGAIESRPAALLLLEAMTDSDNLLDEEIAEALNMKMRTDEDRRALRPSINNVKRIIDNFVKTLRESIHQELYSEWGR